MSTKYWVAVILSSALGPWAIPFFTDGPLTLAPNLKVRTNENGYLRLSMGTGTTDGPLTNFGNIKLRTNENGYLRISCDDCGGAGSVSDTAYAASWDGVTTIAPSKNAVYDKIQAVLAGGGLGTADIDTSAELAAILTDENGTGKAIFSAGTLAITAAKTLTVTGSMTQSVTDGSTVAFGTGGTVLYSGGALGTPSSGTLTNATGLPEGGLTITDVTTNDAGTSQHGFLPKGDGNVAHCISGTIAWVSCVATTAIDTSAELATILTDELGSGKVIFSAGTLAIASGKTLTVSNILTFTGTDSSSVAFGAGGTVLYSGGALGTPSSGTATNITGLPEGGLSLTDITTNNASTSQHGFVPKGDGNVANCLSGTLTWVTCGSGGGGGTPGGSDTYVQFNDSSTFNGESTFAYNKTTNTLTIANAKVSGATGFSIADSDASNYLNIKWTSNDSADRSLSLVMVANRTMTIGGDLSLGGALTTAGAFTTSGSNPLTLTTTGSTNVTLPTSGTLLESSSISDTAYDATTWNGVTTVAPSKNAIRDLIESFCSITDPGADRAIFWDDTDNACVAVTIGSGLTYTHSSHTLTAGSSGLPTSDTNSIVEGSGDASKEIRFEVDGLTTATIRVITAPDSNTTLPIISQVLTFTGPTNSRTITLPDEAFTVVGLATSQTLTNKTYDVEGTGNVFTSTSPVLFETAVCQGSTASLAGSYLSAVGLTANCRTGTHITRGVASFPDSDGEFEQQFDFPLTGEFTGTVDVKGKVKFASDTNTGHVFRLQFQWACTATTEAQNDTWSTATNIDIAPDGTATHVINFSSTGITVTGCSANEDIVFRLMRDRTNGSDTVTGIVDLFPFYLTTRAVK